MGARKGRVEGKRAGELMKEITGKGARKAPAGKRASA